MKFKKDTLLLILSGGEREVQYLEVEPPESTVRKKDPTIESLKTADQGNNN